MPSPLTKVQVSTIKAAESLRQGLVKRINNILVQTQTLDIEKRYKNISYCHRFLYFIGCLRWDKRNASKENEENESGEQKKVGFVDIR